MSSRQSILAKLSRLRSRTVANGCTEAEAGAAEAVAARLMERYGISKAEFEGMGREPVVSPRVDTETNLESNRATEGFTALVLLPAKWLAMAGTWCVCGSLFLNGWRFTAIFISPFVWLICLLASGLACLVLLFVAIVNFPTSANRLGLWWADRKMAKASKS